MSASSSVGEFDSPEVVALITRCKAGDLEAFDELVRRNQRFVFNTIYQHLASSEDVEDVAQEVFLKAFRAINRFRGNCSFKTWLYKITLNTIRTYLRRRGAFFRLFLQETSRTSLSKNEPSFETYSGIYEFVRKDRTDTDEELLFASVVSAVRSLPPMYREILIMKEVEGLEYEEISKILGISVGTVKSRLNRARMLVRKRVII